MANYKKEIKETLTSFHWNLAQIILGEGKEFRFVQMKDHSFI